MTKKKENSEKLESFVGCHRLSFGEAWWPLSALYSGSSGPGSKPWQKNLCCVFKQDTTLFSQWLSPPSV